MARSLKLHELPPGDRAITDRERENQRDYPKPALGRIYAPRTDANAFAQTTPDDDDGWPYGGAPGMEG